MDGDAFIVRTNRAVAELQASAARSEAMLREVLELLRDKQPALSSSASAPLQNPWSDLS
jgi:hypothetical protein